ncbi:MAG: hypothetical protein WCZ87_07060 [Thiohalobacteraceae bacterium]
MPTLDEQLLGLFRDLPATEQAQLLAFAEFLHSRAGGRPRPPAAREPVIIPEPEPIPRPEQESVVKAVKRLAQTYPMLDKSKMLNETSALVTQHIIQGRDAIEVIDELEVVFQRHYDELKSNQD